MFWERFYELCEEMGVKPTPIAKEIGISSAVLTKWKNGISFPNGEILMKMADFFNCSIDYLVGRSPLKTYECKFSNKDILLLEKIQLLNDDDCSEILYLIDFKLKKQSKGKENFSNSPLTITKTIDTNENSA